MKCNRNEATNQRIDRITPAHAIIGIDIAKDTHAAQITDFRGRTLTKRHLFFSNSEQGFLALQSWIQRTLNERRLSNILVGMEPTGHYWFNLANWLLSQGVEVVLVNPVLTHRHKENRDNSPSKNDTKDALVIADLVSRSYYTEYAPQEEEFERLKTAVRNRKFWVKQAVSTGQRSVRWIDLYFPEFARVFPDWTVPRSLSSLRAFPLPDELRGRTVEKVIEQWRSEGMKRPGGERRGQGR